MTGLYILVLLETYLTSGGRDRSVRSENPSPLGGEVGVKDNEPENIKHYTIVRTQLQALLNIKQAGINYLALLVQYQLRN